MIDPHHWRGLINSIPENEAGLRDKAILHVMMNAALTPTDITSLRSNDLTIASISIAGGQHYKHDRIIDVGNYALDSIEEWLEVKPPSGWLFCNTNNGEQLDERSIRFIVTRRSEHYGLAGKITTRMLRKEAVNRMIARGMSDDMIAQVMGITPRAYERTWAHL